MLPVLVTRCGRPMREILGSSKMRPASPDTAADREFFGLVNSARFRDCFVVRSGGDAYRIERNHKLLFAGSAADAENKASFGAELTAGIKFATGLASMASGLDLNSLQLGQAFMPKG